MQSGKREEKVREEVDFEGAITSRSRELAIMKEQPMNVGQIKGTLSEEDVLYVHELLEATGRELLKWRARLSSSGSIERSGLEVSEKDDGSLISAADFAAQKMIFEAIRARFPGQGILSEEGVLGVRVGERGPGEQSWILDPLDGTREFLSGTPDFAIQLAHCTAAGVSAGWVYFPALRKMISATEGVQSKINDRFCQVVNQDSLEPDRVLVRGIEYRDPRAKHPIIDTQVALRRLLVGELDVVIIRLGRLGVWDVAGWSIIIENAGGVVCGVSGAIVRLDANTPSGTTIVFAVPGLRDEALKIANSLGDLM